MTSLPITTCTPQAANAQSQTANAATSGDAQNNPPFGEVLARQINDGIGQFLLRSDINAACGFVQDQ